MAASVALRWITLITRRRWRSRKDLAPGEVTATRFALAWDFPRVLSGDVDSARRIDDPDQ
jgi:hypothetical protein